MHDEIEISGWRETPWRIASSVMNPDYLSVPELQDYLSFNRDFPEVRLAPYRTQLQYRWALPWVCLLVVFIAAPLGIVYSRRGILGSVATAIALFFSLVFFSSLFVALGKGNRISPVLATWGPLAAYFLIGLGLFWFRSTNRDLPKIKLPGRADTGERVGNQVESTLLRADGQAVPGRRIFLHASLPGGRRFRREDISEEAWSARNENIEPFSFWRSKYEKPATGCRASSKGRCGKPASASPGDGDPAFGKCLLYPGVDAGAKTDLASDGIEGFEAARL